MVILFCVFLQFLLVILFNLLDYLSFLIILLISINLFKRMLNEILTLLESQKRSSFPDKVKLKLLEKAIQFFSKEKT